MINICFRNSLRGSFIFALLFLINFALADALTGASQVLQAPFSECSVPPAELRESTANVQLIAEFNYWACREYRSSKSKSVYYRIEAVTDGEYAHMIPAPGQKTIDPMDYRYVMAGVYQSCRKIHDILLARAIPLQASKCREQ